jgi:hypothetical protein
MGEAGRLRWVAGTQAVLAVLITVGIWVALPARWWPVDVPATALALACAASTVGLVRRLAWGRRLAIATSWALLVAGSVTVTALCLTVAHLAGLYGPVGAGGALLMGTMAALLVPYLVVLPALQLAWLRSGE